MTSKKVTRKWEVFAGRNKFLCNGRLITAPHNGIFYLTVFLITSTSILFFVFDCPFLAKHITIAIPCIGAVLFIFTMGSLLRTSFSDPGIIPRAAHDEASYIEKQIEVPNSCNSPTRRPPPRTKEVLVRGQPVKLKYCYTCKIFRPPRASHCSLCDNCVDRFDHHCPWVGNCVGKRNYRFFYMFIVSLAFLAVFIFACGITHLVLLSRNPPGRALLDALKESPASAVVCIVCFLSVWSVLGLAGFHTYLITTDQTTNEDIKGSFSSKHGQESPNPYSRGGVCSNCWHVLCGPVAPSLIDRRGIVTNEFRNEMAAEAQQKQMTMAPPIIMTLPAHYEHSIPAPHPHHEFGEPIGNYIRPLNGSYSNLYRLDEREGETEMVDGETEMEISPTDTNGNGIGNMIDQDGNRGHLYSNLADSHYMNHQLDLDPVVLTGSKHSLVLDNDMCHHIEMRKASASSMKLSVDPVSQNVTYSQERENAMGNGELNHNNVRLPTKMNNGDIIINTASTQTWADRLPQSEGKIDKSGVTVLSASKLRLLHDTTMIDTALDLDSLDGSTVSLWPATV